MLTEDIIEKIMNITIAGKSSLFIIDFNDIVEQEYVSYMAGVLNKNCDEEYFRIRNKEKYFYSHQEVYRIIAEQLKNIHINKRRCFIWIYFKYSASNKNTICLYCSKAFRRWRETMPTQCKWNVKGMPDKKIIIKYVKR